MLAVLEPVREALQKRGASDSWNLQLDKLSFERGSAMPAPRSSHSMLPGAPMATPAPKRT
jgi:hypothetical protein